jgi:hypothetical protein
MHEHQPRRQHNNHNNLYAPNRGYGGYGHHNQQGLGRPQQQRGMQLGGGGGLGGLGVANRPSYHHSPQHNHQEQYGHSQWASHHSDYYYPNYQPYQQQGYHYAMPRQHHARGGGGGGGERQLCHLHGKLRTQANMIEVGANKWEVCSLFSFFSLFCYY